MRTACPRLSEIPRFLQLDKAIPDNFLEHAAGCAQCLRYSSYALAAKEALFTTDRLMRDGECPTREQIFLLLLVAVRGADVVGKINRNIFPINYEGEAEIVGWIAEHINGQLPDHCPFCRDYYNAVFDVVEKRQKNYEGDILARREVRPVIKDAASAINASEIGYNPYDTKHKPN